MNSVVKIPKFRTLNGLVIWVVNHRWDQRLDPDRERLFFTSKETPEKRAHYLCVYAQHVGKLDYALEKLLVHDARFLIDYQRRIAADGHGILPDDIIGSLKGKGRHLVALARVVGRLPDWLEDSIEEPEHLLSYSKMILMGPLPDHLLGRLKKDVNIAIKYAYEVVRGFAPCRLPDDLHAFVYLKSFENPDNEKIKQYVRDSRIPEESSPKG